MSKVIALRFDVDSVACAKRGVPNLLELAHRHGIPFTLFVCMGKSVERTRLLAMIQRARRKGKSNSVSKMGLWDTLTTLVVNPNIGIVFVHFLQMALAHGHELSLHGGKNHGWWQRRARQVDAGTIAAHLGWAYEKFQSRYGKPKGFGSPGFCWSNSILDVLESYRFLYASDMPGERPFQPTIHEQHYSTWQIPVTIAGPNGLSYIEWSRSQGVTGEQLVDGFAKYLRRIDTPVLYGHPFSEGIRGLKDLDLVVQYCLAEGYVFKRMSELVPGNNAR